MNEPDRIKSSYARRDATGKSAWYSHFSLAALFAAHQRETALIDGLKRERISDLSGKRILDLGCGTGSVLRDFIRYGARPENCSGIDLLPDRIERARKLSPNIDVRLGNAENLPYGKDSFEIVLCFTVFTSIFDIKMKHNIAREMLRVLKRDGIILWYDYHVNNPKNPDVRGVKKREICKLFPKCVIRFRRITLAPPIARAIAPISVILCQLLEKVPLLCTHYLAVIRNHTHANHY